MIYSIFFLVPDPDCRIPYMRGVTRKAADGIYTGKVLKMSCKKDYLYKSGGVKLHCQKDGTWDGTRRKCVGMLTYLLLLLCLMTSQELIQQRNHFLNVADGVHL